MNNINDVIDEILVSEEQIKRRVKELGEEISRDYEGKEVCVMTVLTGSFMFAADIVRALSVPARVMCIFASSYEGTESIGKVDIIKGRGFNVKDKDILIVEDIVDTGRTLSAVTKVLMDEGARSVEICTFLDKPERRVVDLKPKYIGFDIPNKFAVGYGLDYDHRYRQFPFVGVLKSEIYEK
ncbi:MAG: hypoxanthine phosphoribosyltransferase [Clostridia bacterium]|nr:hypoxanthine phosphoribosyltransferase [Clostridia bacterium]